MALQTNWGPEKAIDDEMKPVFSMASTIYGEPLINENVHVYKHLNYLQKLQYPPLFKLNN
ncbi:hypothetical protein SAMN06265371_11225 [Lutibacter agarilyticus]|uniref:Uncharacterized protein n=1 Tax=Lutibacter agarilyticus TaxID=1109740 RepID=A0A238Z312_9FLAO|nr:hypothetical protein [Lutibacter agarilyticus]SNR77224.1 hypothetical protein SAMN06265371_11225 [Lutibacter agarilyticus]